MSDETKVGTINLKNDSDKLNASADNASQTTESQRQESQESKDDLDKLVELSQKSEKILFEVRNFSIITPTRIVVDREKISIIQKKWWLIHQRFPILIQDIKTVVANNFLIFGELVFDIAGYERNPDIIRPIWPSSALKAKRIILGLILAKKEGIDLGKFNDDELLEALEKIGQTHSK